MATSVKVVRPGWIGRWPQRARGFSSSIRGQCLGGDVGQDAGGVELGLGVVGGSGFGFIQAQVVWICVAHWQAEAGGVFPARHMGQGDIAWTMNIR